MLEIGKERDGDATGKCVALGLIDVAIVERLGGLLRLAGEALDSGVAENVIRAGLADRGGGAHLDIDLALSVDQAVDVAHVPAERPEKGSRNSLRSVASL